MAEVCDKIGKASRERGFFYVGCDVLMLIFISDIMITILIILFGASTIYFLLRFVKDKDTNLNTSKKDNPAHISDFRPLIVRANQKLIVGDYKGGIAIADKILQIDPLHVDALTTRASGLEALNFNLDAIDDYEKALSIDDSDANTIGLLGLIYRKIGEIDTGQEYLKKSIEKGLKVYEMAYNMLLSRSDGVKQVMIQRGKKPENLTRRNPNDFVDNLSEVDRDEFKEALKNVIDNLEFLLALDPNNDKLKRQIERCKSELD